MLPDEQFEGESVQTASDNFTLTSFQSQQTTLDSPQDLSQLEKHLGGEMPITPQKASESASDIAVSENPQQQQPENIQITIETCTDLISHPDFPFPSESDDQAHVVQPISATQPNVSLSTTLDNLANKESILEPVLQPSVSKPVFDGIITSDSDEEDEHVIHTDNVLDSSSSFVLESVLDPPFVASTSQASIEIQNQDAPIIPPQTINVLPPPTLLPYSIVLKEVCKNIFEDLNNLVKARNDPIHIEKYADK